MENEIEREDSLIAKFEQKMGRKTTTQEKEQIRKLARFVPDKPYSDGDAMLRNIDRTKDRPEKK
jgi:hypothetical protein